MTDTPTFHARATTIVTPVDLTAGPTTMGSSCAVADFGTWMDLARASYQSLADEFADVPADRWSAPTPCAGWSVRDLAGHLVGAMRSAASLRETASQQRAVKRRAKHTGEQEVDAMTAIQVERAADLSVEEIVRELQVLVPKAVAGRGRMPGPVRRRAGIQVEMGSLSERWTFDYFLATILTRDTWLHRVDLADALGVPSAVGDVDRSVVGDVAVEWCARHAQPVALTLTGDAGGTLTAGTGGPEIELDAVEFCRVVSGRSPATHPLLEHPVPF